MSRVKPLFLLSLPRSGSTLLQRVLASHSSIFTTSEPWVLLPLLYPRISDGVRASYDHGEYRKAIDDFVSRLPGGASDYHAGVRAFAYELYGRAAGPDAAYFLDKTPRYHLIARELLDAFPEARFIVLWRNPLAIAASMMDTWADGRWNLYRFQIDLYGGLDNLLAVSRVADERIRALCYEDLLERPQEQARRIFEFLELEFDPRVLTSFAKVRLQGRMGDPTGVTAYDTLSSAPNEKWRATLGNPLRKAWARRYLAWLGADRLEEMGYDLDDLKRQLDSSPTTGRNLASDVGRRAYGLARQLLHGHPPR